MNSEYRLLDSGNLQKLEQAGPFRLIRPALNAFWRPALNSREWEKADATFVRNAASGTGTWHWKCGKAPEEWQAKWGNFTLKLKPTNFGHLGFFAEQYRNWEFFRTLTEKWGGKTQYNALNLFGYSGIGSMAMASGGFNVCHLDAARGMNEWGQENRRLNADQVPDRIRWITDDVLKFCRREIRRGNKYQLIALDPPSFGRGSGGQVWKIEDDLPLLLSLCRELYDPALPFAMVLSCHSPGFSQEVFRNLLCDVFGRKIRIEGGEMTVPESTGRVLPAGIYCRMMLD